MKQSTKLLSLVLALVMAFSCVTVIGSAKKSDVTQAKMTYDAVDDAILSGEQAATILLNYLEATVMPDLGKIDLSILGTLDLTSVNGLTSSFYELLSNGALGLAEDTRNLAAEKGIFKNLTRENGDLNVLYGLFDYFGAESTLKTLKKVPKGLLTNGGIGLGNLLNGIISGLVDLDEINGILTNISGLVGGLVYDMLIYGSYGHDKDAEELNGSLPAGCETIDAMLDTAIAGLICNPQDYTWEGEGDAAYKDWNPDSYIFPSIHKKYKNNIAGAAAYVSLSDPANSIFGLIDKIAPIAIYDLGIQPLNNNLKKALMEAVEAEVEPILADKVPQDAMIDFEILKKDENGNVVPAGIEVGKESYVTYISYDKIFKSADKQWYYTTIGSEPLLENGLPVVDKDGNEKTKKVREFYKVNMATANDFAKLIDWTWNLTAPVPFDDSTKTGKVNEIDYTAIIGQYQSIAQALNHIVYIVAENALSDDAVKYFNEIVEGDATAGKKVWVDGATSAKSPDGKTTVFVYNLERILKFLLAEYADKIFGEDSEYVAWEYSDVENMSIVELIAHIGPTFFEDVMPQLIIPKGEDGRAAFHDGVQLLEFGALVIREFMTEICPTVNYDAEIFGNTITSPDGRQFKNYGATAKEDWFNLILNMGMDIAYTYLNQLTNFNTAAPAKAITEARWKDMLNTVLTWGINYIGSGDNGVLQGINPNALAKHSDPLDKLSYVLNTILPLGFINGCSTSNFDFDVAVLFTKLKDLFQNFNLDAIVSLFGRNASASIRGNILAKGDVVTTVLELVGGILTLVLGDNILRKTDSINSILANDNLPSVIESLFTQLKKIDSSLLPTALPVVCKLIKDLGGEQQLGSPQITLPTVEVLNNGKCHTKDDKDVPYTFDIVNGSTGLWRGYKVGKETKNDKHYVYTIKDAKFVNYDGSPSSVIPEFDFTKNTELAYSEKVTISYKTNVTTHPGILQRLDVTYSVSDEDGNRLAGKDFTISKYIWLSFTGSDEGSESNCLYEYSKRGFKVYSYKHYVDIRSVESTIPELTMLHATRGYKTAVGWLNPVFSANSNGLVLTSTDAQNNNASHDYKIQPFKNGIAEDTGDGKQANMTVVGSFNKEEWDKANYKSGDIQEVTFNLRLIKYKWKAGEGLGKEDGAETASIKVPIYYYDSEAVNNLRDLLADETSSTKDKLLYNTNDAEYYADRLLRTADVDEGRLKETTSTKTVWIDDNKNVYQESQLSDIKTTTYKDSEVVESATAVYKNGDKKIPVKKVTVLNGDDVWNRYDDALEAGLIGAYQEWNTTEKCTFEQPKLYADLYIAATELEQLKKTPEEIANTPGVDSLDTAVDALEVKLDAVEAQYSDNYDYTDYMMYRWNRYNEVREDARDIVNAKKAAAPSSPDAKYFPYTWVTQTDLKGITDNSANAAIIDKYEGGYKDGENEYASFITALLEDYSEDEMAQRREELKRAKQHYAGYDALDVAQAENLLNRIPQRLITRGGVDKTHLANEIASANAMIGKDNSDGYYTDRSWTKYIAALEDAEEVNNNPASSQMNVFDAKWELLCCRNELVVKYDENGDDNEADYSELELLIDQAEQALANQALYDNTAKELGQVLAQVGFGYDKDGNYITVKLANGEEVDLFPGNAHYVNHEPYSIADQDIVDRKADELKEALAKLKFKPVNADVSRVDGTEIDNETIKEAIPEKDIEAEIINNVTRIGAMLEADDVKALFTAEGSNEITAMIVSDDVNYASMKDIEYFAGTNTTITFYAEVGGINIPVATVKLVVNGDVDGDGVVDVIDANYVQLVTADHAELNGCYFLAANLDLKATDVDGNQSIDAEDFKAVVNEAFAS